MKKWMGLLLLTFTISLAQAQEKPVPTPPPAIAAPVPVESGQSAAEKFKQAFAGARAARSQTPYTVLANYTLLEMWVLTKYGLTAAYNESPEKTYELEYMRGSLGIGYFGIDIGKIEEQRLSFLLRSFSSRNSFSFAYGGYVNEITANLGNDYLATVPGVSRSSVELMKVQTLGASFALGNRWQLKNGFVWSFDWLAIYWPLAVLNQDSPFIDKSADPGKRGKADDAMTVFRRIPALGALKIQLGFSF